MTRRATVPLLVALACVVALAITGVVALSVPAAHVRDAAALHGFSALDRPRLHRLLELIVGTEDPAPYALLGLALVVLALSQGRRARALAAVVVLIGSGLTTQVLKQAIHDGRFDGWLGGDQIGPNAWPSGHSTAAMALALCAVLVAPPALRAVAAAGGGLWAAAVGYSVVALAWHYPSDVLGGYLVAGAWTASALAVLRRREPAPAPRAATREPAVLLGLAAAPAVALGAAALAAIALRGRVVTLYAFERPTLVAGALAIAALAGVLSAGLAREA